MDLSQMKLDVFAVNDLPEERGVALTITAEGLPFEHPEMFLFIDGYSSIMNTEAWLVFKRIINCVNACAGMENPENEIKVLRNQP